MQPQQQEPAAETWQPPRETVPQAPYQAMPEPVAEEQSELMDSQPQEFAPQDTQDQPFDESNDAAQPDQGNDAVIRWQGTEYLHQDQTKTWYIVLGVVTVVLMALAIILMQSFTFALLIPVMAVTLVVYTRRPPAINDYILSRKGLHVNDKLYPFAQFKSFSIVRTAGVNSVVLVPRKRFQIAQTLYFPEEIGEQLVDMLAARLPVREGTPDVIDRFLSRLKL